GPRADAVGVEDRCEVWVDASTGAVIGGGATGFFGAAPSWMLKPGIPEKVLSAASIRVESLSDVKQVRVVKADAAPLKFYGALGTIRRVSGDSPVAKIVPTHSLTFTDSKGRTTTCSYDSK